MLGMLVVRAWEWGGVGYECVGVFEMGMDGDGCEGRWGWGMGWSWRRRRGG